MNHRFHDQRSQFLHQKVAEKLRAHPELWEIPRTNIERWLTILSPGCHPYLHRWREWLELGAEQCIERMTAWNEDSIAMRQSTPFSGVLTPKERWYWMKYWATHEKE